MKHDELAVSEHQLQQPKKSKAISISAIMGSRPKCEAHNNPMASALLQYTVTNRGTSGVAMAGEVRLRFIGCTCQYWRPVK